MILKDLEGSDFRVLWHLLLDMSCDFLLHPCLDFLVPSGENMCLKDTTDQPKFVKNGVLITPSDFVAPVV